MTAWGDDRGPEAGFEMANGFNVRTDLVSDNDKNDNVKLDSKFMPPGGDEEPFRADNGELKENQSIEKRRYIDERKSSDQR